METDHRDSENDELNYNGMKWTDIKQFQHRYIIDVPKKLEKYFQVEVELPSPIFDPVEVTDYNCYKELFKPRPKLDRRLLYYKKLYASSNKKLIKETVKRNKFALLPRYVVDVAQGVFEDYDDHAWCYTGGTLDCFSFNNNTYITKAGLNQPVHVMDLNSPSKNISLELEERTPVYSLKSLSYDGCVFLAVRQKCKLSLFSLSCSDCYLEARGAWKAKTSGSSFVDMTFNEFRKNEIATVDTSHNLKIKDFTRNTVLTNYDFTNGLSTLSDNSAQIDFIDRNTLGFINRCCIYLLDLRSLSIQKSCQKTTWLKCDDLCTFSKNENNYMYVSSTHNLEKFDIRSLKVVNRVKHMLSTNPFISSCVIGDNREYICLSGQNVNDSVLLYSSSNLLNTPQYIPNVKDTLTTASLIRRLKISEHLEDRLSLPILGMKLYKDVSTDTILYTLNAVGDVFKQRILHTKLTNADAVQRLVDWSNILPCTPKVLEATSICNLNNIKHNISARFPEVKKLNSLMKENSSQKLFEKEFTGLTKYLEGSVGESMNSIWGDEKIVEENDADISAAMSSQFKVSEWLESVQ